MARKPTKSELYKRAGELGVANRDQLDRDALAEAVRVAEEKGNPMEEPMPEQVVAARGKDVEELAVDAVDEDKRKAKAAERELAARAKKAAAKPANPKRRVLPTQYVVTKGCNISSNGSLTRLAEGSIISAKTHNLNAIKKCGGEYEECKGKKLIRDQFGRLLTVPVQ